MPAIKNMREDAQIIINRTIEAVMPEKAVLAALSKKKFDLDGKLYLIAIGKAAYSMASAAKKALGDKITGGIVITKYGHARENIDGLTIIEAGHPIPDENSIKGTQAVLDMTANLADNDEVLFLISGGGSALFEKPTDGITPKNIEKVTEDLIYCGADIVEINTIRKRLSAVKGGRFAVHCSPAKIFSVILSDVIGDRLDFIASGPAYPDSSTTEEVSNVVKKYKLEFESHIIEKLKIDTPKIIENTESVVIGSVGILCREAANAARELGYEPFILCSTLSCEAREGGRFLAAVAKEIQSGANDKFTKPCAIIVGGETVVTVKGNGKGGRNQEFALAAADLIDGYSDTVIFSVGSDGTDGPTDAAGGIVDGDTKQNLLNKGIKISDVLNNNDSYNALKQINNLVITGATGTNVNDFAVLLCR